MTAIVGVICSDGVVIGTDSSMTMVTNGRRPTIEHPTEKLRILHEDVIVAGTGSVGHGQRFEHVIETYVKKPEFAKRNTPVHVCTKIAKLTIEDFALTKTPPRSYGALVGFVHNGVLILCEFGIENFQPELKNSNICWCSMGSTQMITDPFMAFVSRILWPNGQPSVRQAMLAVTWTLDHAVTFNPGGVGGPLMIAVLKSDDTAYKAEIVSNEDLHEHRDWIEEAEEAMRQKPLVALDKASVSPRLNE